LKVLPFTIPVPHNRTIIVQEEVLPYFYPHLHRHAEVQITWILQGEGTLLAGNSMHVFGPGEIYVLGTNQPHLFKSSPEYFADGSDKQIKTVTIFFDPSGKLSPLFNLPEMKQVQAFAGQWQNGYKIPDALYQKFAAQIQGVMHSTGGLQLAQFIKMLNDMSLEQMEQLSPGNYTSAMTDPEGMRIASVYNYIMHNYSTPLTLNNVAKQAHLTPNAFCRYFKKHTRLTLVAFVNKVRVNEACKLLVNGGHNNIAGVAYSCGFSSITNFNYVFKSITGKSPRAFLSEYEGAMKNSRA
jgi:AraC-like DNA-binding protein